MLHLQFFLQRQFVEVGCRPLRGPAPTPAPTPVWAPARGSTPATPTPAPGGPGTSGHLLPLLSLILSVNREEQCEKFNQELFERKYYDWIPYLKAPRKCELNCMPKGERFYYRHAKKVRLLAGPP